MTIRKRTWKTKDGTTMTRWTVDVEFRHPDGRVERIRQASPVNTRRGAQRLEHELRTALLAGTFGKEKDDKTQEVECPRLKDFAVDFIRNYAEVNNKFSSVQSKKTILRRHLIPFFGAMRLDQIGAKQIERFKAQQLKRLSKKSINNQLTVLRKLLAVACEWGYLQALPSIKWLKAPKPDFRYLDFEQAHALLEAAQVEPEWAVMILLAMRTGLRQGELLALRWRDINFNAGRLVVRQAVSRGRVGTPKGGRQREVPLTASVREALRGHRHLRGELVFCQADGSMLSKGMCKHPLRRAKERAGLKALGWHDLRHTFASHLAMRGVPLKAIQELMGHATIDMTMRYAHLTPRVLVEAVDRLEDPQRHIGGTWLPPEMKTGS